MALFRSHRHSLVLDSQLSADLSGAIRSQGHNIFGEVSNVSIFSDRVTGPGPHSTDIFGSVASPVNALLGPLADNGGMTFTHALLTGSLAINGGSQTASVPATDQRGFGRAGLTDIGAFENQAPVGVEDSVTTEEDLPVIIDVLANDFERDGESFSVVQVQDAQGGAAVINQDGTILFTPDVNFHGVATFSYVLEDAAGLQSVTQVSITVTAVNDAPVAQDDFVILDEDTLAQIGVLTNDSDVDGDDVTLDSILTQPAHGSVQLNLDGTVKYTPAANFHGTDSFTYRISDGNGGMTRATVTVNVISRQNQMTALKAQVQQLLDTDVISSKQSRTLQGYLKFGSDANQTVSLLNQFQAEVQKLVNNQTLSSTIGQMLISVAEKLKRSVSIFASTGGGGNGNGKGPK